MVYSLFLQSVLVGVDVLLGLNLLQVLPLAAWLCLRLNQPPIKVEDHISQRKALPTKTFICKECGKSFKDKKYIELHKRSHSGEKPHPCEDCGKSFTTSTNLILHKKIHSEERPFPCNQCDKSFKVLPSLKDHIIRCHVVRDSMYETKVIEDGTEKLFPCDRCPKYSTTKHSLKVHQLTHTREKAFACDQCEKSFSLKFNWQVHQRRHLEEHYVMFPALRQLFTFFSRLSTIGQPPWPWGLSLPKSAPSVW